MSTPTHGLRTLPTYPYPSHHQMLTLVRGGYLLDSRYGKRDAWNSTGGRCTSVMVHTNPEQTPERYRDELDAWWNERRAARREAQR